MSSSERGAANGSGSQAVTITGYNVNVGEFAVVAGNDQPTYVTARTLNMADTTAVTLNEANKYATLAAAVITVYKKADVVGAHDVGHSTYVRVEGHTASKGPQVGQLIAFGTGASRRVYTVIEKVAVSTTVSDLLLDRPTGTRSRWSPVPWPCRPPTPACSMPMAATTV